MHGTSDSSGLLPSEHHHQHRAGQVEGEDLDEAEENAPPGPLRRTVAHFRALQSSLDELNARCAHKNEPLLARLGARGTGAGFSSFGAAAATAAAVPGSSPEGTGTGGASGDDEKPQQQQQQQEEGSPLVDLGDDDEFEI